MSIKAYKVESDDEEGKNWHTVGYAVGLEKDILQYFDDSKAYSLRLEPIDIVNVNKQSNKNSQYQVFYKRDIDFEKRKKYGAKMLFDKSQKFNNEEKAYEFAHDNIPSLMIEKSSSKHIQSSKDSEYIVAARFEGKYHHECYDGSSDPLTNYDILRCKKSELEKTIEEFAKEGAEEIITGVEVKLF